MEECINQLKNITSAASRQEIQVILRKNKKKIHHSVYKDWEAVRKTSIMILKHLGIHISTQNINEVDGVLIDMPSIWEGYLEKIFQKNSFSFESQKKELVLLDSEDESDGKRELKPDFFFEKEDGSRVVLDAKYKKKWSDIVKDQSGIWEDVREDVFQVMSYMYALKAKVGGIICPVSADSNKGNKCENERGYQISKDFSRGRRRTSSASKAA